MNKLRNILLSLALMTGISTAHALTPGPDIIRQCPSCTNLVREMTIGSGNKFGAKWWTDGKCDAPMLPMEPELVKCPHCRQLFWMADAKKLATLSWGGDAARWAKAKHAMDCVEADYLDAAKAKGVSRERELTARKRAWWLANDAVRQRKDRAITIGWSGMRRENLEKLSALINEKEECEILLKAEIARELGQFEACLNLLHWTFKEKGCESNAAFLRELARKKRSLVEPWPSAEKTRP